MREITGEQSSNISSFKLSATDTDTERRNFQGYQTHSLSEAMSNEISMEGTTETRKGGGMNKSHSYAAGEMRRRF
jgi:hypothetical protein